MFDPPSRRDRLELIGVALSTAFFVVLVLPTLVLGIVGRWLVFAGLFGTAWSLLTTDTIWHWLP